MKKFQTIFFFIITDDKFHMCSTGAKLGLLNLWQNLISSDHYLQN